MESQSPPPPPHTLLRCQSTMDLPRFFQSAVDQILGSDFASDLAEFFERITATLSALILDTHFE